MRLLFETREGKAHGLQMTFQNLVLESFSSSSLSRAEVIVRCYRTYHRSGHLRSLCLRKLHPDTQAQLCTGMAAGTKIVHETYGQSTRGGDWLWIHHAGTYSALSIASLQIPNLLVLRTHESALWSSITPGFEANTTCRRFSWSQ